MMTLTRLFILLVFLTSAFAQERHPGKFDRVEFNQNKYVERSRAANAADAAAYAEKMTSEGRYQTDSWF